MNLYIHIPFCAVKCAYCALHSRPASTPGERARYISSIANAIRTLPHAAFSTVYIGGGTPSQCNLAPIFSALQHRLAPDCEFTVECNPADSSRDLFAQWLSSGVNRISFGVQSFHQPLLAAMNRRHTATEAVAAVTAASAAGFTNIGIDLIAGYPGLDSAIWRATLSTALSLPLSHISIYSLILEPGTPLALSRTPIPSDDAALDQILFASSLLSSRGFSRYEISNYSLPSFHCRHNMAVWMGEDYIGLGEGAHGRIGLVRTIANTPSETLSPRADALERFIFSLRTSTGLDLSRIPTSFNVLSPDLPRFRSALAHAVSTGLCTLSPPSTYTLTPRGMECCDSILSSLL